jgi:hypothetical protein
MSNDVASSSSSVAPPDSAPDSSPPSGPEAKTPPETLAHLAKGEDLTEYAEQRAEDAGEINRDLSPAERSFNRHQRARAKIERLRAEVERLREHHKGPRDADGTPEDVRQMLRDARAPEEAAARDAAVEAEIAAEYADPPTDGEQQGGELGEQPETHEQAVERLAAEVAQDRERERHAGSFQARNEIFELLFPDAREVLRAAPQVPIPTHVEHAILAAKHGPFIRYLLAQPHNQADLVGLLQAPPEQAVRALAGLDAKIEEGKQQRFAQQRQQQQRPTHRDARITRAQPPIKMLRGSGGQTPSLAGLANSDNIDRYAEQRMRQMRTKDR